MEETMMVIIVGAGPAGLATAACLQKLSITSIILEREDCIASLWRKRAYDRLHLHLAKEFCSLPHVPHSSSSPTYIPKDSFIQYLDTYASTFGITPKYNRHVESASFDDANAKWHVVARNDKDQEVYTAPFLVVATGEEVYVPLVPGIERFEGEIIHSSEYKSGKKYQGKDVLVVGCGNSGMEIAYDLSTHESHSSIVIRSPVHIFSRDMIRAGMTLLKYLPVYMVDTAISWYSKFKYGDLSKYGIRPPVDGPFYLKSLTGRSPVIDVGTIHKIKAGEIKVMPTAVSVIKEQSVVFENGDERDFDAIVFATGYKNSTSKWLKVKNGNGNGPGPGLGVAAKWKGNEIGLYMAGFSKRGLMGIKMDAEAIASDIEMAITNLKLHKY